MSDIEDDSALENQYASSVPQAEDVEHDERRSGKGKVPQRDFEVEEEEGEEDEEDDDDDEDDPERKGKKRTKHRHKRSTVNRFIDLEALVDEEEEEDEEDEEYGRDEFIASGVDVDEEDVGRRAADHARLDRQRELDDQDLIKIAHDLNKRYGQAAVRYTGDMNEVPQRLLMPSVHDASLWQVRVKPGRERDIVFSLMRKAIDLEYTARPLQILSAFQRDSLAGMIYVEARSSQQVSQACNGLVGVYPSRGISLVPIEEMASLLQIKKQDLTVTPGSWVRIKRGKYQGDLAQVMDITENGEDVGLKFIPRIDLNPRDDLALDGKKRKKAGTGSATMRPPQRFFNYEEVIKVWGRKQVSKRNQVYVFQNDTYKDGFIEKDFKLSGLVLENVNPTLDEITRFTRGQDGTENENAVDLSIIAEASRKAAISVLQPGDHVEVFEGEQSGVHGVVQEIAQDVVTISAVGVDIDGQKVDLPARSVRKRFKPGDHVKVMAGQNADETGLVVSVTDNIVTFLSDMSMQEVSVFSKDLREAAEVGSGTNIVGNYELHDLVQLDLQTIGVIFKTERDSFRVLDQNGQVRLVQPHQISMRRDSDRAIASDSEGHELRINDNVKEIEGEGRKGRVLHIYQSFFAFLHNRDIVENGGVFVTRARSLASLAPKGNLVKTAGMDLSKMNPALGGGATSGGMVGSGNMGRGPRDRLIGLIVVTVKGLYKGYVGTIKDTNGPVARVELHTGNKVITIDQEKIKWRDPKTNQLIDLDKIPFGALGHSRSGYGANAQVPNTYHQQAAGGRTPAWAGATRTPNPYTSNEGRTPAWMASSRTPNPYAIDGSRTPAWNSSSRTPNPYAADGGRTPAWNANSRTPNPYSAGAGSSSGGGWATPRAGTSSWNDASRANASHDGTSPRWSADIDVSNTWNAPPTPSVATPGFHAPQTPGPAPTPLYYHSQTPAGMSAPTPGVLSVDDPDPSRHYVVPELWLVDADLSNKQFYVVVKGTYNSNYRNGEYEGKQGIVKFVSNPQSVLSTTASQIAKVQFAGNEDAIDFLVEYLVPVPPGPDSTQQDQKQKFVVLDGMHKGEELSVQQFDESQCAVSKYQDDVVFDIPTDKLAKIYQPDDM